MNSKLNNKCLYKAVHKGVLCLALCVVLTACVRQGGNVLSTVPYGLDGHQKGMETLQADLEIEKAEALKQREKSRVLLEKEKE